MCIFKVQLFFYSCGRNVKRKPHLLWTWNANPIYFGREMDFLGQTWNGPFLVNLAFFEKMVKVNGHFSEIFLQVKLIYFRKKTEKREIRLILIYFQK